MLCWFETFMKKLILFLLALGIVAFYGCAMSTKLAEGEKLPKITDNDYSTVYMSRESKAYGFSIAYPIQFNGVYLFRIGSGDCVTFKIPTGQSEIVFIQRVKAVKFLAENGKKYYFHVWVDAAGSDFRQLTEEEWNEKQKACDWVELKEKK